MTTETKQNPFLPEALRALMPSQSGAIEMDDANAESGMKSVGALLKSSSGDATWVCPDCGQDVKPVSFGDRFMPSAHCQCKGGADRFMRTKMRWYEQADKERKENSRQKLLTGCQLDDSGQTFSSWRQESAGQRKAYAWAKRLVQRLNEGQWSIWWGTYGCGKTHLAHAIATDLVLEHGKSARVTNWLLQLREIQRSWSDGTVQEGPLWSAMLNSSVLFLDDFDKQLPRPEDLGKKHTSLPSSWYMESLYTIIEKRYSAGKPTVLIANQSFDALSQVLQAIGGTAVDAVLSRFNRSGSIMVDWSKTGLSEYHRTVDYGQPNF